MISVKEEIKMASELLASISKDDIERAHRRSRRMFLMDMAHDRAVMWSEGYAEGYAEGLAEYREKGLAGVLLASKLKMAKAMLSDGLSLETAAKYSRLSEEEITKYLPDSVPK
jgi:predicted transposase/invertase (TIGR01784 family)